MEINFSGKAKAIVKAGLTPFSDAQLIETEFIQDYQDQISEYVRQHADEIFIKDNLDRSDYGEFTITHEQLATIDTLKLEEFSRILMKEAADRDLVIMREDVFSPAGIRIKWMPREDLNGD